MYIVLHVVYESIKDYTSPEVLEGDNKYCAGTHGMQVGVV